MSETKTFIVLKYIVCLLCIGMMVVQPAYAGKLDDFEDEATEEDVRRYDDDGDGFLDGFFGALLRGFFKLLFWRPGDDDYRDDYRRQPSRSPDPRTEPYEYGEQPPGYTYYNPRLWTSLRLDGSYQNVESDIGAFNLHSELGLAFLGVQGRFTYYREEDPDDHLWLSYIHGLARFPIDNTVQISPGVGAVFLYGENQNSGFSMTVPVLFYPRDWIGVEFRPTWSWINENTLSDHDLGVVLGSQYASFKAGYRWVYTEREESLDGPYMGVTFQF
jgi:hypothetical protein